MQTMTLTTINFFFIGSMKEKFNLNFLLDIFNGKITLKKAEINQRDLNKKIEELKFNYKPKNEKEINRNKWSIGACKWHVGIWG